MILIFHYYDEDAIISKCSLKMKYIFQYFQPCCICNNHTVKVYKLSNHAILKVKNISHFD